MRHPVTATQTARAALAALAARCARIRANAAEAEARRFHAALYAAAVRDLRTRGLPVPSPTR